MITIGACEYNEITSQRDVLINCDEYLLGRQVFIVRSGTLFHQEAASALQKRVTSFYRNFYSCTSCPL